MPSMIALREFCEKTFFPLKLRSGSNRTRQLYLTTLRNLAKYLGRDPLLSDFDDDAISAYLSWFTREGHSPFTTNKERAHLLCIWRFACRKGILGKWPDVQPEIEPKRIPQAWSRNDVFRLFESLKTVKGTISGIPANKWWVSLHFAAWDSGERISALLGVKWQTVDLEKGYILVPAELRKGKRSDRLYKIERDTVESLKEIALPARDLVWPWDMHWTYVWKRYGVLLKRAGLPHDSKSKFHRIRRSVASHAEAAGMDATSLLGHSARKVTLKYLDPRIVGDKHAVDVLFRPVPH